MVIYVEAEVAREVPHQISNATSAPAQKVQVDIQKESHAGAVQVDIERLEIEPNTKLETHTVRYKNRGVFH